MSGEVRQIKVLKKGDKMPKKYSFAEKPEDYLKEVRKKCRDYKLIKVLADSKKPFEKDWQNTTNYEWDSKELGEHLKKGGNYGVVGNEKRIIIDVDRKSPDFEEVVKAARNLPKTFEVITAKKGIHLYYLCEDIEKGIRFRNEAGEVRAKGMMVVGPGSKVDDKEYKIIADLPLAIITKKEIEETFQPWLPLDISHTSTITKQLTDKTRSGKEFGIVCKLIRKGKTKEEIFKEMEVYAKWSGSHQQYREYTYNNALKRTKLEKEIESIAFKEGKFVPKQLGDAILNVTEMKTLKGNDKIYRYHNGVYLEDGKELIKEVCADLLKNKFSSHYCNETVSYIQAKTYINPEEIDNEWINLENGLLHPITKEFKEHTPETFSTIRIPIKYDPKADCPLWKKKLEEKVDKFTRKVVQQLFGYCYLPKQKYEVAFLFYGPMRTMKSTTLYLLERMLGDENVTAYSLQWLTENPFSLAYLYGKSANICPDLSSKALKDTGTFMTITGGDKISSARKHEHPISFYPSVKLIYSCNNIPPTSNKNLAFYRRWIIMEFKTQHSLEDIDVNLKEKLLKELAGVLNWALDGLKSLLENGGFNYWLDEEEVKDLYERGSNSIQSFIYHSIDSEDDESVLKKREVYMKYKEYCEENDLQLENQIKFGRLFIALTGCGTCKSNKIPAYQGTGWKENGGLQQKIMEDR